MFLIEEKLANEILNYMIKHPWIEVNNMVAGLQMLKRPETKNEPKGAAQ